MRVTVFLLVGLVACASERRDALPDAAPPVHPDPDAAPARDAGSKPEEDAGTPPVDGDGGDPEPDGGPAVGADGGLPPPPGEPCGDGFCEGGTCCVQRCDRGAGDPEYCVAPDEPCDAASPPVCGCDGHTYDNACAAHAQCVGFAFEGPCLHPDVESNCANHLDDDQDRLVDCDDEDCAGDAACA